MSIVKLEWRWWWDNSGDNAKLYDSFHATPIASGRIKRSMERSMELQIKYPEWGGTSTC